MSDYFKTLREPLIEQQKKKQMKNVSNDNSFRHVFIVNVILRVISFLAFRSFWRNLRHVVVDVLMAKRTTTAILTKENETKETINLQRKVPV